MQLLCPHCDRTLDFSGARPRFCGYCGRPLTPAEVPELLSTQAASPPASVADQPTRLGAAVASDSSGDGPAPDRLGNYRLLRKLGGGGMGAVYEAEDVTTGRRAAVKLIGKQFRASGSAVERFRQEGRLASTIAHPRCVFVLAADEEAGQPYIVMELMPGETLEDLVRRHGPLPIPEALARILDVIEGLQEAHHQGFIHRDVKPSNCFLDADGRVKVGDFGLAKSLLGSTAQLTRTGAFVGTPLFASPEQVRAEGVDQQSDVYSVTATLFFLLTGRAPFQGPDPAAVLARIVADPAPSARDERPEIPRGLDRVLRKGLERDKRRRWKTLEDLADALRRYLPARMSVGGLGLRFFAYALDAILIYVAQQAVLTVGWEAPTDLVDFLTTLAVELGFYGFLEGRYGASPGKFLLRLRVRQLASDGPPGLKRGLLRFAVFHLLAHLGDLLNLGLIATLGAAPMTVTAGDLEGLGQVALRAGLPLGALILGHLILLVPMRAGNGYRGLHELASGTRTVRLPWPRRRRRLRVPIFRPPPGRPAGLPERVGPYTVLGAFRWTPAGKVVLAEDPALGRQVGLWLRPGDQPPLPEARRALARAGRFRWLGSGALDAETWDAFLMLPGCPLPFLVAQRGPLAWADARTVLADLAEELTHALADGTLPALLTADQVWLQTNGRAQLVDSRPFDPGPGPLPAVAADPGAAALAFLAEVAVLALEGRPRPPDRPHGTLAAPIPGHARQALDRLTGPAAPYPTVAAFAADLEATHDRPAEVTRGRRAGHLAIQGLLLAIGVAVMLLSSFLRIRLQSGPIPELTQDSAARTTVVIWAFPLLWAVWAALTRGGWSLKAADLMACAADGRPAPRWRCALRCLLVWAPVAGLLSGGVWLAYGLPTMWWLALGCWGLGAGLVPAWLGLALWRPQRSLHDRLAGTGLIPQ